ncbi:TonB family protein [Pseudoduganella lutea]|uniref:TonB family protein n=1 Tax=Pseudoduganella lutea TaxID=321985 RepID=A0A4P6KX42_9BURK|nr:TonB family protein [Pseudoduganella lutea]QBE63345.1 TonB family protein [Pseudoduganella lutea]
MPFPTLSRLGAALVALSTMSGVPALADPVRTAAVADFTTCARPVWPKEALREKQHGTVTLSFLISASGAVTDSKVTRSSRFPLLDVAALEGIMKCRFQPSTVDSKAIPAWVQMQYVWTLEPAPSKPDGFDKAALTARAEQGDTKAQVALARYYQSTMSADRDPARGAELLRSAATAGDLTAIELLASSLRWDSTVPKDLAQSAALYRRGAEHGSPNSQNMLAEMLLRGEGVAKDEQAAEDWLRKAAAQGNTPAQVTLASRLQRPGGDTAEMIALLDGAVAANDPVAQRLLGWCRENGTGVAQDYAIAAELYRKAAAVGDNPAKEGLARLYENGRGVPLDVVVADALKRDAANSARIRREAENQQR